METRSIFAGDRAPNFATRFPLSGVNAIAEIFHDESEAHEEQAANARLIQAAPELFEALEALLDVTRFAIDSKEREIHLRAEAALRTARGEKGARRAAGRGDAPTPELPLLPLQSTLIARKRHFRASAASRHGRGLARRPDHEGRSGLEWGGPLDLQRREGLDCSPP
jgi:hypothetical protein